MSPAIAEACGNGAALQSQIVVLPSTTLNQLTMTVFLDDNFSGIMASWVQAGCAIGTIILGIVMFIQKKRIEELTDVVLELRNQTKELSSHNLILQKQYEHEREISARSRMPYFEIVSFETSGDTNKLILINRGLLAHSVTFEYHRGRANANFELESRQYENVGINETILANVNEIETNDPISFMLYFAGNMGNTFYQEIICYHEECKITSPKDGNSIIDIL